MWGQALFMGQAKEALSQPQTANSERKAGDVVGTNDWKYQHFWEAREGVSGVTRHRRSVFFASHTHVQYAGYTSDLKNST